MAAEYHQFRLGFPRTMCLAAVMALSVCLGGCATLLGENFNDDYTHWGERQRQPEGYGQLTGVSTKSQQIERNLGLR